MANLPSKTDTKSRPEWIGPEGKMIPEVYQAHSSPDTAAQRNLLKDISPKVILRAFRIMFAKHTVPRKTLPICLDLEQYRDPNYEYDTSSTEAVGESLKDVALNAEGMKFIYEYDGDLAVKFYGERFVDIDYDELVDRVEISRVGDCFRDVLGINTEVLHRDDAGRPKLQIERIAALAQPSYTAFLGKDELDVYKLEYQEYGKDEVRNWMRTVCSPNASTSIDDSYMALRRMPDGKTKIEFVAHQQFPLPRIMVLFGLSRWPWFREILTRDAYRKFWTTTSDNILARYRGQEDVFIGRPAPAALAPTAKVSG